MRFLPFTKNKGGCQFAGLGYDSGGGGSYTLPPATASMLGGVKVGTGLAVESDGTLSASGGGGIDLSTTEHVVGKYGNKDLYSITFYNSSVGQNEAIGILPSTPTCVLGLIGAYGYMNSVPVFPLLSNGMDIGYDDSSHFYKLTVKPTGVSTNISVSLTVFYTKD